MCILVFQDEDECASNPCGGNGNCIDLLNEFACICYPGFSGIFCETGEHI